MTLTIKTLTGAQYALDVSACDTVGSIKAKLQEKIGILANQQTFVSAGQKLDDSRALGDYQITDDSCINLVLNLSGGGKKRKKKNYTTPKKIKHTKKKVKLPVLKFYKVDADGKITRLRRECPNTECGAGVFMAWHTDRQYCGRCGLTYVFNKEGEQA